MGEKKGKRYTVYLIICAMVTLATICSQKSKQQNNLMDRKVKRSFKRPFAFPKNCVYRPLRQISNMERNKKLPADRPTYFTLNAPPSLVPAKKYSDISGLPAPYADPHTKLRYANADEYASMQNLPSDIIHGYLTVRGYTSAVG